MDQEYEAKFLDIDAELLKTKLVNIGSNLVHKKGKYTRAVYHMADP